MNILNIFNNLVTLSSPHSPTHTLPKQPQCSYKYNVYQHIAPASQGNPPMSAASEESTADFLPKALQTGKKGDRAAETGRQKRAAETGGRTGRQDRGGRTGAAETGGRTGAAGPGRQKRGGRNGAAGPGRQEAVAGEWAEGTGSRRLASKKAGQEHRKTEYGQEKLETEHKNPKTETGSPKTGRESPETGRGAGCRRDRHSESEADRAGTKQKKETRNQD